MSNVHHIKADPARTFSAEVQSLQVVRGKTAGDSILQLVFEDQDKQPLLIKVELKPREAAELISNLARHIALAD